MTQAQLSLFLLAHVLLACALQGTRGHVPAMLAMGCAIASFLGLAHALGDTRREP